MRETMTFIAQKDKPSTVSKIKAKYLCCGDMMKIMLNNHEPVVTVYKYLVSLELVCNFYYPVIEKWIETKDNINKFIVAQNNLIKKILLLL